MLMNNLNTKKRVTAAVLSAAMCLTPVCGSAMNVFADTDAGSTAKQMPKMKAAVAASAQANPEQDGQAALKDGEQPPAFPDLSAFFEAIRKGLPPEKPADDGSMEANLKPDGTHPAPMGDRMRDGMDGQGFGPAPGSGPAPGNGPVPGSGPAPADQSSVNKDQAAKTAPADMQQKPADGEQKPKDGQQPPAMPQQNGNGGGAEAPTK